MKIAASNIAWDADNDAAVFIKMAALGYTGLEIAPSRLLKTDSPYAEAEKAIIQLEEIRQHYGLQVCSMQSIIYGARENIFESTEERSTLLDRLRSACDFARAIGCENLVFGCPANRNMRDKQVDHPAALAFFNTAADIAADRGVTFSLEPVSAAYNTNFLNTIFETTEFVSHIGKNSLKINLDAGNLIDGSVNITEIAHVIPYVNHVHISEPGLEPVQKRTVHGELFELLRQQKYDKFISIEMKNKNDMQTVFQTLDYIAGVFHESNENTSNAVTFQ